MKTLPVGMCYFCDMDSKETSDQPFEVVETADGSHTVYSADFDEHYHSHHGALAESRHVFLKSGLMYCDHGADPGVLRVFEMGFGTGLNALLALQYSRDQGIPIEYWAVEKYPLPTDLCHSLNYPTLPGMEDTDGGFRELIDAAWNIPVKLNADFSLRKIEGDFFDIELPRGRFDLIFFDAFGSRAQPDMWEELALRRCFDMLVVGGAWVTYAAKGSARRAMEAIGFDVERIPGAPGKREMMRAVKTDRALGTHGVDATRGIP